MNDKYEEDDLINRVWTAIIEKQHSINEQMEKSFNKLTREREEGNRLMEESEKNYFRKVDQKNLEMKELDTRIHKQLEENKLKKDEEPKEEEKKGKNKNKPAKKKKKRKARAGKNETPESIAENRYEDYGYIYDAIRDADFPDEEKQALMEAVSDIQQRFTKPAE